MIVNAGDYGGDVSEYHPITDPLLIAASRHYEAVRKAKEYAGQQKRSDHDAAVWKAAMDAIREATKNGE